MKLRRRKRKTVCALASKEAYPTKPRSAENPAKRKARQKRYMRNKRENMSVNESIAENNGARVRMEKHRINKRIENVEHGNEENNNKKQKAGAVTAALRKENALLRAEKKKLEVALKDQQKVEGVVSYECGCTCDAKIINYMWKNKICMSHTRCPTHLAKDEVRERRKRAANNLATHLNGITVTRKVVLPRYHEYNSLSIIHFDTIADTVNNDGIPNLFEVPFEDETLGDNNCFRYWILSSKIRIRHLELKYKPQNHNELMKVAGGNLPKDFVPPPQQILRNVDDGTWTIVSWTPRTTSDAKDYVILGPPIEIPAEIIDTICRQQTARVQNFGKAERYGGSAGGHEEPCDEIIFRPVSNSLATHDGIPCYRKAPDGTAVYHSVSYYRANPNKVDGKFATVNVYPDLYMDRYDKHDKRTQAIKSEAIRMKLVKEMQSRLTAMIILQFLKLDLKNFDHDEPESIEQDNPWRTFLEAVDRASKKNIQKQWRSDGKICSDWELILLEYACATGEMRNHQALACHKDGNKSHMLESMMLFGKVAAEDETNASTQLQQMKPGFLAFPHLGLYVEMRCGIDVLHSHLKHTYHAADETRNTYNMSFVHGP